MNLITLGGLELAGADFQRAKPLLLLAYLSVEGKQSRAHLAELFWQGAPKGESFTARQRRNNLSRTLSDLRKHAPESFNSDQTQVWSLIACDFCELREALQAGDYTRAAATYKGAFLEGQSSGWGVELEEWIYEQRERLVTGVQEAMLKLAEDATLRPEVALQQARAAFRLAEPRADMLPRFHTLFAEQDKSLAREVRDLARGYGVMLTTNILGQNVQQTVQSPTPAITTPHNLPHKGTSFVGRDVELSNCVNQLLQPDCKLLSLVAIGGAGKSRLALQTAFYLLRAGQFQDGIHYIALETLTTKTLIPSSIAESLGLKLKSTEGELEQLSQHIGDKQLLLILDNFEHLIDGATLLPELLRCPNLKLLSTSRERLNIEEEWVFPLAGLALPATDASPEEARYSDAVQLFVQRATQAQLTFELSAEDMPHVLELCHLVLGSPLALELAAVWTKMMTPATLLTELERNLDILTTNSKNRDERHQNLRAVFEHSWGLLAEQEQRVLKKLSVFRGGFTRQAAAEVAGSSLGVLASLVNKSLLRILPSGRYDRHPLLLQYTNEKLAEDMGELEHLQDKHFDYFLTLAEKAEPLLDGPKQKEWLERLELEHDNFRTALRYVLSFDNTGRALSLLAVLWQFWNVRGHYSEGRVWLDKALSQPYSSPSQERGKSLIGAGSLAQHQGDYKIANGYLTESLNINRKLHQPREIARALINLAGNLHQLGKYDAAAVHYKEALSIYQTVEDKEGIALALQNLGTLAGAQGDPEKASSLYLESLHNFQKVDDRKNIARMLIHLGTVAIELEQLDSAHDWLEQGLATSQELGHKFNTAYAFLILGILAHREDNYNKAQHVFTQSLLLWQELGHAFFIATALENFTILFIKQKEGRRAARLIGAVQVFRENANVSRQPSEQAEFDQAYSDLVKQLSKDVLSAAEEEGRRMTIEQAIDYALEQTPDKTP